MPRPRFELAGLEVGFPEWGSRYSHARPPEPKWPAWIPERYRDPRFHSWEDNPIWPGDYKNFVRVNRLLAPKLCRADAWAALVQSRIETRGATRPIVSGFVHAELEIEEGIPTVRRLEVRDQGTGVAITGELMARVPVRDLANRATATLCLTDRPETRIPLSPNAHFANWLAHADGYIEPSPADLIPKPDLIAPDGRPWWRVRTTDRTGLDIDKAKRPKLNPDFYREVLRAQRRATEEGRRDTTQAVREWFEDESGRKPGESTVRKWIAAARKMDKGEDHA